MIKLHWTGRCLTVALVVGALSGCATIGLPGRGSDRSPGDMPMVELETTPEAFLSEARGIYVVVDLDSNLLRLMDGEELMWEAPVGTGTGLRLKGDDGDWHFTTPTGVFQIQYKEEMPVWYLPDWYFIEKDLPIPTAEKDRRLPGQLGVAAVYIGEEIAIHGTDKPELLGQRVSHGCIRLANDFARRLYHNVQVGTPVVVIGGEELEDVPPGPTTDPGGPRPVPPDPLAGVSTAQLLQRLDRELARATPTVDWVPLVSRLITRGLKDDTPAIRGVLERAGKARSQKLNREYATFLADTYHRGSWRAVVSLARIDPAARDRAAKAIVEATMALHGGTWDEPTAPWPTRRISRSQLGPEGSSGWLALQKAESAYRERLAAAGEAATTASR